MAAGGTAQRKRETGGRLISRKMRKVFLQGHFDDKYGKYILDTREQLAYI